MKIQGSHVFANPREEVWAALLDPNVLVRTLPGCERLDRVGPTRFEGALTVTIGPVKGQFQGSLDLYDLDPPHGYRMKLEGKGSAGFMTGEGTIALRDAAGGTELMYDLDSKVGGRVAGVGQRLLESSSKVITRQGIEGLERQLVAIRAARVAAAAAQPTEWPTAGTPEGPPAAAPDFSESPHHADTDSDPETPQPTEAHPSQLAGGPAAPAPAEAFRTPTGAAASPQPAPSLTAGIELPPAPTQAEAAAAFARGMANELISPALRRAIWIGGGLLLLAATILVVRGCGG